MERQSKYRGANHTAPLELLTPRSRDGQGFSLRLERAWNVLEMSSIATDA